MSRRSHRATPLVVSGYLYTNDAATGTQLDSPAWFTWLATASSFYFDSPSGSFTAHLECRQRGGSYWIAYRRRHGVLRRVHLGKAQHLTRDRLLEVALILDLS